MCRNHLLVNCDSWKQLHPQAGTWLEVLSSPEYFVGQLSPENGEGGSGFGFESSTLRIHGTGEDCCYYPLRIGFNLIVGKLLPPIVTVLLFCRAKP